MSLSNVISGAVNAITKNPRILIPGIIYYLLLGIGLFLLFVGPLILLAMQLKAASPGTGGASVMSQIFHMSASAFNLPALILFFAVFVLIAPLLYGFYNDLGNQYCKGKISMSSAFERAKNKYISLLVAYFLITIITLFVSVLLIALAVLGIALLSSGSTTNLVIGALAIVLILIIAILAMVILFYEAFAVIMIEDLGAFDGISRSIQIGRKYYVPIVILLLIIVAASIALSEIFRGWYSAANISIFYIFSMFLDGILYTWVSLLPALFYNEYVAKGKKAAAKRKG